MSFFMFILLNQNLKIDRQTCDASLPDYPHFRLNPGVLHFNVIQRFITQLALDATQIEGQAGEPDVQADKALQKKTLPLPTSIQRPLAFYFRF